MLRGIGVICVSICLLACASASSGSGVETPKADSNHIDGYSASEEKIDFNYWITLPRQGELVVIGVSGRQSKPGTEIDIAREDAARKISMYYSIQAELEIFQSMGSGYLDYFATSNINVTYNQEIDRYLDKLSFDPQKDVFTEDNSIFIYFTYPETFPVNINYESQKNPNGSPEWTTNRPPEIDGFLTGVGFVRRQEKIKDAIIKSTEAAAASIVSQISSSMNAGESSTFTQGSSYVYQHSKGKLTNFLVVEMWIDPVSKAVWTLAVAQNSN